MPIKEFKTACFAVQDGTPCGLQELRASAPQSSKVEAGILIADRERGDSATHFIRTITSSRRAVSDLHPLVDEAKVVL